MRWKPPAPALSTSQKHQFDAKRHKFDAKALSPIDLFMGEHGTIYMYKYVQRLRSGLLMWGAPHIISGYPEKPLVSEKEEPS